MARMQERGKCRGISYSVSNDFTSHTNPNAATTEHTRDIGFRSTGADTLGRRRQCQTYSTHCRGARPEAFLAGRPAAERAADARRFRLAGFLLLLKLAIRSNRGTVSL